MFTIQKKTKDKIVMWLGGAFSGFAALALGTIAAASFMILFPGVAIGVAVAAGAFSFAVEGEVYWSEVRKAFRIVFINGPMKHMRRMFLRGLLKQKLLSFIDHHSTEAGEQDKELREHSEALYHYKKILLEYERLQIKHHLHGEEKERFLALETQLHDLEDQLYKQIKAAKTNTQQPCLGFTEKEIQNLSKQLSRRTVGLFVAGTFAVLTGIGFAAFTFIDSIEVLGELGAASALGATSTLAIVGLVASLAFIAYGMTMYRMLSRFVEMNGSYVWKKAKEYRDTLFKKQENEGKLKYGLKLSLSLILSVLLVGFIFITTAGTAGAWLGSGRRFFALFFKHSANAIPLAAEILSRGIVLLAFIPVFCAFLLKNCLASLSLLIKKIFSFEFSKGKFSFVGFLRASNPFYLLSQLLTQSLLAAHAACEGMVAGAGCPVDSCKGMAVGAGAGAEWGTDLHFLEGDHHNVNISDKEVLMQSDDGHSHGKITKFLLFIPQLLLLSLAFVYDLMFTQGNCKQSYERAFKPLHSVFKKVKKLIQRLFSGKVHSHEGAADAVVKELKKIGSSGTVANTYATKLGSAFLPTVSANEGKSLSMTTDLNAQVEPADTGASLDEALPHTSTPISSRDGTPVELANLNLNPATSAQPSAPAIVEAGYVPQSVPCH